MRESSLLALTLAVLVPLSVTTAGTAGAVERHWSDGLDLSYSEGGFTMPYRLYLPKDYSGEQDYPSVFYLHGGAHAVPTINSR